MLLSFLYFQNSKWWMWWWWWWWWLWSWFSLHNKRQELWNIRRGERVA